MTGTPPDPTDETLLLRAARGDRAAFDLLAGRYLVRLYRLVRGIVQDDAAAEDVAQQTLIRAWEQATRFDPARARVSTWLHRIAVNLAIDHRRRAARAPVPVPTALPDPAMTAPEQLMARQRRHALADAISLLPTRQRTALALTYAEGRPGQEAAGLLGISARALEGLLRRARLSLRTYLDARDA